MVRLVLVGFGHVAREFARLLVERRRELARVHGLDSHVVAILTAHHGRVESPRGIDLRAALPRSTRTGPSMAAAGRSAGRRRRTSGGCGRTSSSS